MSDRVRNFILVITVAVCLGLLCLFTYGARSDTKAARDETRIQAKAVADLSSLLSGRSPVLAYLACKDKAHDDFDTAQGELFDALVNRELDRIPELSAAYQRAIAAVRLSEKAVDQGGCGELARG